jgi:hypothetical protein
MEMPFFEEDETFIVRRHCKVSGKYCVLIPWNHMTSNEWKLASLNAGDLKWQTTRDIAYTCNTEAVEFHFMEGTLRMVQYYIAKREDCGSGYKGHGMSSAEKVEIEQSFVEYDNDRNDYVYLRKPVTEHYHK